MWFVRAALAAVAVTACAASVPEASFGAPCSYVIVTHDDFYESVLPLAEWKHRAGHDVVVVTLSETGADPSDIKAYLQNAYDTWENPPEYVLLVGDTEYVPVFEASDDYYVKLEGDDYVVDAHVGRFSVDAVEDCDVVVAKTLAHERFPHVADPTWFGAACLVVREDYDASDVIYFEDTWLARDLMLAAGFTRVDTLFRRNGAAAPQVIAAVSEGRSFVNYRGQGTYNWWMPFDCDPEDTDPQTGLPIVMSATCGTGKFDADGYACEQWLRAGTPSAPRGAVAFCGSSLFNSPVAELRSAVNQGFYRAIFEEGARTLGEAFDAGRLNLKELYDDAGEYAGWNIQGDPALPIWTAAPRPPDVSHSATVPNGPGSMLVTVALDGEPVEGALVCASATDEVHSAAVTDSSGVVELHIEPVAAETVHVTVTGRNLQPYEGHAAVTATRPHLVYSDHAVDDSQSGNGDALVSPGEHVNLTVTLENAGPGDAVGVTAVLRTNDAYVTLVDTLADYGDVPGGASADCSPPFAFTIAPDCPGGRELDLAVVSSDTSGIVWTAEVPGLTVATPALELISTVADDPTPGGDGDGSVERGETASLELTIGNDGPVPLVDVTATLIAADTHVAVTSAATAMDSIPAGGQATATAFRVSVSPTAPPGGSLRFLLDLSGDAGTYEHSETLDVVLELAGDPGGSPTGPDSHGYYAYDSGDTLSGRAPMFAWVDLTGTGTLIAGVTDADAGIATLPLPFTFTYYGATYDEVSVCSNGFISLGAEDYRFGDNSPIPSNHGPSAMVAPLWDDLDPSSGGDVYQWYDAAGGCWICQFDSVARYLAPGTETFQVILKDPAVHATGSGDGDIVVQYGPLYETDEATVGIESPAQSDGIQYVYDSAYDETAAPLTQGLAVRFTTEPPAPPGLWLSIDAVTLYDGPGGDGVADPGERFDLVVSLLNRGTATASAVTAAVSTDDPDASIVSGYADIADVPPGETRDNATSPFVIEVAASPSGGAVDLEITVTADGYVTSDVVSIAIDLSGGAGEAGFLLRQSTPNPFRRVTTIGFNLSHPGRTSLDIFDLTGRKVATLLDAVMPAGPGSAVWDGTGPDGTSVPSGVYFCRLRAGSSERHRKLVRLR
jgi:hypothetical protein